MTRSWRSSNWDCKTYAMVVIGIVRLSQKESRRKGELKTRQSKQTAEEQNVLV